MLPILSPRVYFVDAIACHHNVTWTIPVAMSGRVFLSGILPVQLMISNHRIILPSMIPVQRWVTPSGFLLLMVLMQRLPVHTAAHNDGYIVAYKKNGAALTGSDAPLKLVGPATTRAKQRVGGIVKISLEGLPDQYPAGNWQSEDGWKDQRCNPAGRIRVFSGLPQCNVYRYKW